MRKTVHEWLESHQWGNAMAKKNSRRKPVGSLPRLVGGALDGKLVGKHRSKKKSGNREVGAKTQKV